MRSLYLVTGTMLLAGLLATGGCGSVSSTPGPDSGTSGDTGSDGGVGENGDDGGANGDVAVDATTIDAANVSAPSNVVSDGYVTTGPWAGYGFTATDPGAAQIIPTCGTDTCDPPFVGKFFCMHGTVTGRADYTGFAMLGWNVNQDRDGGAPLTWAVPATGGIVVTVDNPSNTPLRVQLQGTNPHSGADRWCAPLVSGKFIPWSSLLTNCWAGGNPQNPLTPGTPLEQAAIIVPGLQVDLPFDFCLVDVEVESGPANGDAGYDGGADGGGDDGGLGGGDDGAFEGGDDGSDGGWTTAETYPG